NDTKAHGKKSFITVELYDPEPVEPEPEPVPAIAKSALVPVPDDEAQINPTNVAAVLFFGEADANAEVIVTLVDMNDNEATATVTANASGEFTGTIDASTLADGMVTLFAGVGDESIEFADYLKDAAAVGAPTDLAIVDVPDDNGGYVYATFKVSSNHFTNKNFYNVVKSYVFYRDVLLPDAADANDTTCIPWVSVPGDIMPDDMDMVTVMVPTRDNDESTWRVLASTGEATTDMAVAKEAGIAVSAFSNAATGGAVDNIAPAPFADFSADVADGGGVQLAWDIAADAEANAQHGVVGSYTFMGQEVEIYGVEAYEVYRKTGDADFALIGTAEPGATSFVDDVETGSTVYKYYVKAMDSNPDHVIMTTKLSMISTTGLPGDNDGDGLVGASDFAIFAANYGTAMADDPENWITAYDLNADGVVNSSDFAIFASGYGATLQSAKAAVEGMPASDIPFSIGATVDESTSTYFVNVKIDKAENLKGFEFFMSYNDDALEFVNDGSTGLVGLSMTDVVDDGVVRVSDWFVGEDFGGTATLAFRSKGMNSDMTFEILNAVVDVDGLAAVTETTDYTARALPTVYSLSQNYPNPFNPTTTIDYSIPQSGNVELAVFNMTGQKVRTLVSERQDASFYKVVWDGRNDLGESVASGLYFYRLVSGNFNKIEKMTLVK
ncbi:MAG: T9SS type A sorting domain-containing protein, partial [Candidatus Latescibacteria bacterium]|nr:T9SS type A sorting domain-containing protein [Candidatus Latescibacterota bacterium]